MEAMFGEDQLQGLPHLTQTRSDADLCTCCPVYKSMAKTKKPERMGRYQTAIDKLLVERGCKHLGVNVTPEVFKMITSVIWYHNNSDSVLRASSETVS